MQGAEASQHGPIISYLLFADDSILFGKASVKGVRILKEVLHEYELNFGQCLNFEKTIVFSIQTQGVH